MPSRSAACDGVALPRIIGRWESTRRSLILGRIELRLAEVSVTPESADKGDPMASEHNAESVLEHLPQAGRGGLKSYSPIQLFFLWRLSYLQKQRREFMNVLDANDWRMRALNKALYSTYRDCVDSSVGDEAKLLIAQQQQN